MINPVDARYIIIEAQNGDPVAQHMLSELAAKGRWRTKRAEKKAAKQAAHQRRLDAIAKKHAGAGKLQRFDTRTFGTHGTHGAMAGFHQKDLARQIAADAAFAQEMPMATQSRGMEIEPPSMQIDEELYTFPDEPVEEKTWIQKNWPYVVGGGALLIGGILIFRK